MTYLIDSYGPQYGASAVSANGFARYIFSAAFPLFAIQSKSVPYLLASGLTAVKCMIVWASAGRPVFWGFSPSLYFRFPGYCSSGGP